MIETVLYVGSDKEATRAITNAASKGHPSVYATTIVSDAVDRLVSDQLECLLIGTGIPERDVRFLIRTADANPPTNTLCHQSVYEKLDDSLRALTDETFDPDDASARSLRTVFEDPVQERSPGAAQYDASSSNRASVNRLACLDREGTYLWVNESMAASIEKSEPDIAGSSLEEAPPRHFLDGLPTFWSRTVRTESEQRRIVSDSEIPRVVRAYPVDERRYLLHEEPHKAEFTFDGRYLDRLNDLFFIVDFNGRLMYWNELVNEVTKYSDAELAELNAYELFEGADRERAVEAIGEVRKDGERSIELQLVTKEGETIPYEFSASLIEDENVDREYVCGIGRDISGKVEMQAEIESVIKELRQSNSELEHFAYVASHDLKEPLRTIRSFLELLEIYYGDELDEDGNEYIEFAMDGAIRMSSMIDDLLEYSRISGEVTFESVNTDELFEEVYKNLELTIRESNARVTSDPLPAVAGDKNLLIQLFQNLIDNAIKHADSDPRIHVTGEKDEGMVQFTVTDENDGMTDAETEDIFELFSTGHDETGSGIGLATCKKIVESHGGSIGVESEKGVGSAFYFTIPEMSPKQADERCERSPPQGSRPAGTLFER